MSPGELLVFARHGDVVVAPEGRDYPPMAAVHTGGPKPWEITGRDERWTNGDLLAMSSHWRLLGSVADETEAAS